MRFQKNPLLFSIADLLFEVRVKYVEHAGGNVVGKKNQTANGIITIMTNVSNDGVITT